MKTFFYLISILLSINLFVLANEPHVQIAKQFKENGVSALDYLKQKIQAHRVVLLAEGTHGVIENTELISQSLKELHKSGLRLLALEEGAARQEWVESYLNGKIDFETFKSDLVKTERQLVQKGGISFARMDAPNLTVQNFDLFRKIKEFNDSLSKDHLEDHIQVLLFDIPSIERFWGLGTGFDEKTTDGWQRFVFRDAHMANRILNRLRILINTPTTKNAKALIFCGEVHGIKNTVYNHNSNLYLTFLAEHLRIALGNEVFSIYLYNNFQYCDEVLQKAFTASHLNQVALDVLSGPISEISYDYGSSEKESLFKGNEFPLRLMSQRTGISKSDPSPNDYNPKLKDLYDGIILRPTDGIYRPHDLAAGIPEGNYERLKKKLPKLNKF